MYALHAAMAGIYLEGGEPRDCVPSLVSSFRVDPSLVSEKPSISVERMVIIFKADTVYHLSSSN